MISISLNFKWLYWLILIIIIIIIIWFIFGKNKSKYDYVGLKPLYDKDYTDIISRWNRPEISHDSLRSLESQESRYAKDSISSQESEYSIRSQKSKHSTQSLISIPVKRNNESKGEYICRQILNKMYNKKFISCRPNFLKNPKTGRNLELDGYNAELHIAFEYNGKQHYEYPNRYHKTQEEFQQQVRRDKWKLEQCELNGIYLIRIPYTVKFDDIESYIKGRLPKVSLRSYV